MTTINPGGTKNSSWSGIKLTTSRLHSFIMAKVSHALNHSAMEAELTTSRLHSFIMAKVSHALNHSAMDEVNILYKIADRDKITVAAVPLRHSPSTELL